MSVNYFGANKIDTANTERKQKNQDEDISMKIRHARNSDLASLLELYNHLHPQEEIPEIDLNCSQLWQEILDDKRLHCFVADEDSTIIASCILDIVPNLTRGMRPFAVLQNVVTHETFRGKGIGKGLNQFALDFAWKKNCYQVLVQTGRPEVTSFYEGLGFKQEKTGLVARPPVEFGAEH